MRVLRIFGCIMAPTVTGMVTGPCRHRPVTGPRPLRGRHTAATLPPPRHVHATVGHHGGEGTRARALRAVRRSARRVGRSARGARADPSAIGSLRVRLVGGR